MNNSSKVPKEGFVIKMNKAANEVTVTYRKKGDATKTEQVTVSMVEDRYQCSCDTFTLRGTCFHVNNSKSLLQNALDAIPTNQGTQNEN